MKRHLEYPNCSLYRYLLQTARKYPGYDALNYFGRKISFRTLTGEISRTARALTAAGVKKGDSVSVCLPNIPQAVFLFYAINKVGAVANMIHPMSAENEIIRYMELTESRHIFFLDSIDPKRLSRSVSAHTCRRIYRRVTSRSLKANCPILRALRNGPTSSGRLSA